MTLRLPSITFATVAPTACRMLMTFLAVIAYSSTAYADSTNPLALDDMLQNFVHSITLPMEAITYSGAYIFGVYLIMKALFKCVKYSDEGSKGQQKFSGIWGMLTFGSLLIALPNALDTAGSSLFGAPINGFTALSYSNSSLEGDASSHIGRVIITIQVLMQMIGLISLTRGLSILRSVTDGSTQVTTMAGLTHIIAGAIAWNFGGFVDIISHTINFNIMTGTPGV